MTLSDDNSSARMVSEHFPGLSDLFNSGLTVFNRVELFYPQTLGSDTHLQPATHVPAPGFIQDNKNRNIDGAFHM